MLSQSKKAIEARQWRAAKRERRRFNMIIAEFTKTKFGNVYREGKDLYNSLNAKYPTKHDLTKTNEFKQWKNDILDGDTSGDDSEKESDSETGQGKTVQQETVSEQQETPVDNTEADNTEADDPEADNTEADDPQPNNTEQDELDSAVNLIQLAGQDLLPLNPELNDLDDRIDQIIRELQEDNDLRDYLNAERNGELVHASYEDDDEGIGLNVDTELEGVLEPFDFELEVEGEDW